jgi:hypothetical protein
MLGKKTQMELIAATEQLISGATGTRESRCVKREKA